MDRREGRCDSSQLGPLKHPHISARYSFQFRSLLFAIQIPFESIFVSVALLPEHDNEMSVALLREHRVS